VRSNFSQSTTLSQELAKRGQRAEHYFTADPNTALPKLRQFAELVAQEAAARIGVYQAISALSPEIKQLFHSLLKVGNAALGVPHSGCAA